MSPGSGIITRVKQYRGGCGGRSLRECRNNSQVTRQELAQLIRDGEVEFVNVDDENLVYLSSLKSLEKKSGDTSLLCRIIRGGGFVSYIEHLERK